MYKRVMRGEERRKEREGRGERGESVTQRRQVHVHSHRPPPPTTNHTTPRHTHPSHPSAPFQRPFSNRDTQHVQVYTGVQRTMGRLSPSMTSNNEPLHMLKCEGAAEITGEINSCGDFGGSQNCRKYSENGKSLLVIMSLPMASVDV